VKQDSGWNRAREGAHEQPVFEFVSLTCLDQTELDGDEVFIEVAGARFFPSRSGYQKFRRGTTVVNSTVQLGAKERESLHRAGGQTLMYELPRLEVPQTGLMLKILEYDLLSRNDFIGQVLVRAKSSRGLPCRELTGDGGRYELVYRVAAG
jgi:hypothetical protein